MQQTARYSWTFQENTKYLKQLGGYRQQFSGSNITIELLTVKVGFFLVQTIQNIVQQVISVVVLNNTPEYRKQDI